MESKMGFQDVNMWIVYRAGSQRSKSRESRVDAITIAPAVNRWASFALIIPAVNDWG